MYHYEYVSKKQAAPYKAELIEIINKMQDEVRDDFTFQFTFIGSSSRNMITFDSTTNSTRLVQHQIALFARLLRHFFEITHQ